VEAGELKTFALKKKGQSEEQQRSENASKKRNRFVIMRS
jgi:hypothetical protein